VIFVLALFFAFWDLGAVKSEPDLEKRSELALANADRAIDEARKAYNAGDQKAAQAALDEVSDSVVLSYDSLQHTHTAPRKSKYYKRAEQKLQGLIRRLSGFRDEVSFDSRQSVERVVNKLSEVHDQLITDIMSKKKPD
jgi:hypothetical protein